MTFELPLATLFEQRLPTLRAAHHRYHEVAAPLSTGAPSQLLGELRRRINNAEEVLRSVNQLVSENEQEHMQAIFMAFTQQPNAEEQFQQACKKLDTIWLFTESFYWNAHRAIKVIISPVGNKSVALPGQFGGIHCRGMTDVRNHLIEHPYVRNEQFSLGGNAGPSIGGVGSDGKNDVIDKGLFVNAAEWAEKLTAALDRASGSLVLKGA